MEYSITESLRVYSAQTVFLLSTNIFREKAATSYAGLLTTDINLFHQLSG